MNRNPGDIEKEIADCTEEINNIQYTIANLRRYTDKKTHGKIIPYLLGQEKLKVDERAMLRDELNRVRSLVNAT